MAKNTKNPKNPKNTKNIVRLSSRKLHFEYKLTTEQLDEFLNDNLDLIIVNETAEQQALLRITSSAEGVIINHGITQSCWERLSKYLNDL